MKRFDEQALTALFHRILAAAIAAPVALASGACGGKTGDEGEGDAGAATDSATSFDAPGCAPVREAGVTCGGEVTLPCGVQMPASGFTSEQCTEICGVPSFSCGLVSQTPSGPAVVRCFCAQTGRRPAGLAAGAAAQAPSSLGAYFASMATLEAASVTAFEILMRELEAHGAPKGLVRRAERAARDEVRHASVVGALARRHGVPAEEPQVAPRAPRSLEEIARENAVEGCVRETFGALLAMLQGRAAGDRTVAGVLRRIARDETRHAALAWSVAEWAEARLDAQGKARVEAARRAAVEELRHELSAEPPDLLVAAAGLPRSGHARAMVDAMTQAMWS